MNRVGAKYYVVENHILKQEPAEFFPAQIIDTLGLAAYDPGADVEERRRFWYEVQSSGRLKGALMMILKIDSSFEQETGKTLEEVLAQMPAATVAQVLKDFVEMNFAYFFPTETGQDCEQ